MGLDMYLFKTKKVKGVDDLVWVNLLVTTEIDDLDDEELKLFLDNDAYNDEDGLHLFASVAYWRKANAIHNFIYNHCRVGNQEDYEPLVVRKETLLDLKFKCEQVIAVKEKILAGDSYAASAILPTMSGFFFGSVEYDDGYIEDVENTVKKITEVIANLQEDELLFYCADY